MRVVLDRYLYKEDVQAILNDLSDDTTGSKAELIDRLLENAFFDPEEAFRRLTKAQLAELCRQRGQDDSGTPQQLLDRLRSVLDKEVQAKWTRRRPSKRNVGSVDKTFLGVPINASQKERQVFFAYSYKKTGAAEYRRVLVEAAREAGLDPVFADDSITNLHILQKIAKLILESPLSVFDVTEWNPNVTLELGLAFGFGRRAFIAFNETQASAEVPADIRGLDRIQYTNLAELKTKLVGVMRTGLPSTTLMLDWFRNKEGSQP